MFSVESVLQSLCFRKNGSMILNKRPTFLLWYGVAALFLFSAQRLFINTDDFELALLNFEQNGISESDLQKSDNINLEKTTNLNLEKDSLERVWGGGYKPFSLPNEEISSGRNISTIDLSTVNVLLIKVPKTGATTFAVTLQRFALEYSLNVANPKPIAIAAKSKVNTCSTNEKNARLHWEDMLKRNEGLIDIFISHACFRYFMVKDTSRTNTSKEKLPLSQERKRMSSNNKDHSKNNEVMDIKLGTTSTTIDMMTPEETATIIRKTRDVVPSATGWKRPESNRMVVTVLRDPFSRLVSNFRYILKCCNRKPTPLSWCTSMCHRLTSRPTSNPISNTRMTNSTGASRMSALASFATRHCAQRTKKCNTQFKYLTSEHIPSTNNGFVTPQLANKILDPFHFIFLTEFFDECLILFHLKFDFPFHLLPYMVENTNTETNTVKYTQDLKEKIIQGGLQPDQAIYSEALYRYKHEIQQVDQAKFTLLLQKLRHLKQQVASDCVNRRGECLATTKALFHATGCFHQCIDASVHGKKLPPVPMCVVGVPAEEEREQQQVSIKSHSLHDPITTTRRCPSGIFTTYCQRCTCSLEMTATCTFVTNQACGPIEPHCER